MYNKAYRAFYGQDASTSSQTDSSGGAQQKREEGADGKDELDLLSGVASIVLRKSPNPPPKDIAVTTKASTGSSPAPSTFDGNNPQPQRDQYQTLVYHSGDESAYQVKPNIAAPLAMSVPPEQRSQPLKHLPSNATTSPMNQGATLAGGGDVRVLEQPQPSDYPWPLFETPQPSSALLDGIPYLENIGASQQSAYYDMDIDVSDMNFDLSSLLSSETPPQPNASSLADADSFGVLPPDPPSFPINMPSQPSMHNPATSASLHPGDDFMKAWRTLYTGSDFIPNLPTGDHNTPSDWPGYGFRGT